MTVTTNLGGFAVQLALVNHFHSHSFCGQVGLMLIGHIWISRGWNLNLYIFKWNEKSSVQTARLIRNPSLISNHHCTKSFHSMACCLLMGPKSLCNEWGGNIANKACDIFIYGWKWGDIATSTLGKLMTSKGGILWQLAPWVSSWQASRTLLKLPLPSSPLILYKPILCPIAKSLQNHV